MSVKTVLVHASPVKMLGGRQQKCAFSLYLEFFNLREHPFRLTPDADFLYLSAQHARAKACMEQASIQRDALAIVTGEIGCGKSTLVNRVLAEMPADTAVARLTQTNLNSEEFLQSVLSQFGFKPFDRSKAALRCLLDNFLFAQNVRERTVVLIVEEAQNLSHAVLTDICALADRSVDNEKRISIVLVGQPALSEILAHRDLKSVVSQARCTVTLEPLSKLDTTKLIEHRFKLAGCSEPPMDADVIAAIYRHTGGVPRLIVNLCDTALTAAYVEESPVVTMAILKEAVAELKYSDVSDAGQTDAAENQDAPEPERHLSLTVAQYGNVLREVVMNDTRLMIGRDSDNDLVLKSEFISRHHAQLAMDHDGRYRVKDLNSTNGVYLNGRKIKQALLHDGDQLQIGRHELIFHDGETIQQNDSATEMDQWRDTQVMEANTRENIEDDLQTERAADSA